VREKKESEERTSWKSKINMEQSWNVITAAAKAKAMLLTTLNFKNMEALKIMSEKIKKRLLVKKWYLIGRLKFKY
jgi:hypothetical protein